nr:ASCH domain-containing protein [uncultured Rhodoferax sp.]
MSTLRLSLIGEYFHQIKAGAKLEEYRLCTPYWAKRLVGRSYDQIEIAWGYPKANDKERRILRKWTGYTIKTMQHKHFGPEPVTVFAIDVSRTG